MMTDSAGPGSSKRTDDEDGAEPSRSDPAPAQPRILASEDLLQGNRELWIEHGDQLYRLRLTRAGKLYLTK